MERYSLSRRKSRPPPPPPMHQLEFELIERQRFENQTVARSDVFEFIEVFYNRQRSHQTLDYRTPAQAEDEYRLVA